jgi:hypothetical protein
MTEETFEDYYEILQVSPNANNDTVERIYRLLAKRYHPDNQETGNAEKFGLLQEAFRVISDPEQRAAYDVQYDTARAFQMKVTKEASSADGFGQDNRMFHNILSILYVARRRDVRHPGIGIMHLERMMGCPEEYLEFHVWYLKRKGWVEVLSSGQLAITVDGVDRMTDPDAGLRKDRLIAENASEPIEELDDDKLLKEAGVQSLPE